MVEMCNDAPKQIFNQNIETKISFTQTPKIMFHISAKKFYILQLMVNFSFFFYYHQLILVNDLALQNYFRLITFYFGQTSLEMCSKKIM